MTAPETPPPTSAPAQGRRNARMAAVLGGLVAFMVGLSFAAVPLYDLFCRVTGFGGTTQVAAKMADHVVDRTLTIRFNADVNHGLPWHFRPAQTSMVVKAGEPAQTTFHARNDSNQTLVGTATYNVTPDKAGIFFNKVQCFCFTEQVLKPGESIDMPVYFFVDPAIADDPKMKDVTTITLSYTFFLAPDQSAAARVTQAAPLDGARPKDYQESAQVPVPPAPGAAKSN